MCQEMPLCEREISKNFDFSVWSVSSFLEKRGKKNLLGIFRFPFIYIRFSYNWLVIIFVKPSSEINLSLLHFKPFMDSQCVAVRYCCSVQFNSVCSMCLFLVRK